jgi:hypothetical protein
MVVNGMELCLGGALGGVECCGNLGNRSPARGKREDRFEICLCLAAEIGSLALVGAGWRWSAVEVGRATAQPECALHFLADQTQRGACFLQLACVLNAEHAEVGGWLGRDVGAGGIGSGPVGLAVVGLAVVGLAVVGLAVGSAVGLVGAELGLVGWLVGLREGAVLGIGVGATPPEGKALSGWTLRPSLLTLPWSPMK